MVVDLLVTITLCSGRLTPVNPIFRCYYGPDLSERRSINIPQIIQNDIALVFPTTFLDDTAFHLIPWIFLKRYCVNLTFQVILILSSTVRTILY